MYIYERSLKYLNQFSAFETKKRRSAALMKFSIIHALAPRITSSIRICVYCERTRKGRRFLCPPAAAAARRIGREKGHYAGTHQRNCGRDIGARVCVLHGHTTEENNRDASVAGTRIMTIYDVGSTPAGASGIRSYSSHPPTAMIAGITLYIHV